MVSGEEGIDRGRHEQGEHRADGHARCDHHADIEAARSACALGDQQRHHGHHHGRRGHEDGPEPDGGRMLDRLAPSIALLFLQLVGEVHHQDAVLGNQPDQGDEPDLRIDVDGGESGIERDERAEHRGRQGDQDDQRVAEALILRGEHEEDDHQREDEGVNEGVALLDELPALALEIVSEAFRKALRGLLLEKVDGLADGAPGERHGRQRRRVELLEIGERVRLHHLGHGRHVGERDEHARAGADLVAREPILVQPKLARHLRNDLIAPPV